MVITDICGTASEFNMRTANASGSHVIYYSVNFSL